MPERWIEVHLPADRADAVRERLAAVETAWCAPGDLSTVRVLVRAEEVEPCLDALEPEVARGDVRVVVLPVEASAPREERADGVAPEPPQPEPARISRAELYDDLAEFAEIKRVTLLLAALSAVVAALGIAGDSPAVVIGAMVIAPLLGPNMALALATTLGDTALAARALRANLAASGTALAVALAAGALLDLDLAKGEVAARTAVSAETIALALASGTAGALAVTTGVASSLVGVMVAVSLLPPLVAAAMLLVDGHFGAAGRACLLLSINVVCVNLAGVATFYLQGIRPRTWWEAERSKRATRIALAGWLLLLALLAALVALASPDLPLP